MGLEVIVLTVLDHTRRRRRRRGIRRHGEREREMKNGQRDQQVVYRYERLNGFRLYTCDSSLDSTPIHTNGFYIYTCEWIPHPYT